MNDRLKLSGDSDGVGAPRKCGRGEDLVAYLYGESGPEEARSFSEHLRSCAACRDEMAAFGGVRQSMVAWREEVLRDAPRVEFAPTLGSSTSAAGRPARRRSALAALREFFALSPPWLRAGSVAAALAVCALAALTFARAEVRWDDQGLALQLGTPARVIERRVEVPTPGTFTRQQVDEIAGQRVKEALEAYRAESVKEREGQALNASAGRAQERVLPLPVRDEGRQPRRSRPAGKERERPQGLENELAEEDELPRLYDLLREAN